MGLKEALQKMKEKKNINKELLKRALVQDRVEHIVEERKKSCNEREMERYMDEDRESIIKERLERMRKVRQDDIWFNHNPLDIKNITNHTDWEVLKEPNQFKAKKSMFVGQRNIFRNNKNIIRGRNLKLI